jgi:hypothetical protein
MINTDGRNNQIQDTQNIDDSYLPISEQKTILNPVNNQRNSSGGINFNFFEFVKTRKNVSQQEKEKRVWIGLGAASLLVVSSVYLIVVGATKKIDEQKGIFTIQQTQEQSDGTAQALKNEYQKDQENLLGFINKFTLTNPVNINEAGLLQKVNLRVAGNYKLAVTRKMQSRDGFFGEQGLTEAQAFNRLVNTTIVKKQIIPAINNDVTNAELVITYKSGQKITLRQSSDQVLRNALLDYEAAIVASSHETIYNPQLGRDIQQLKVSNAKLTASQLKYVAATQGVLDELASRDICVGIGLGTKQAWNSIPSVTGQTSDVNPCPPSPIIGGTQQQETPP